MLIVWTGENCILSCGATWLTIRGARGTIRFKNEHRQLARALSQADVIGHRGVTSVDDVSLRHSANCITFCCDGHEFAVPRAVCTDLQRHLARLSGEMPIPGGYAGQLQPHRRSDRVAITIHDDRDHTTSTVLLTREAATELHDSIARCLASQFATLDPVGGFGIVLGAETACLVMPAWQPNIGRAGLARLAAEIKPHLGHM